MANFEYIDEVEAAAEEEAKKRAMENKSTNSDRAKYWEDLIGSRYEVHKVEELNSMGKGKRSRSKMVCVCGLYLILVLICGGKPFGSSVT